MYLIDKWVKVFKNEPSKICGRQPLRNFTWFILEYLDPNNVDGNQIQKQQYKINF